MANTTPGALWGTNVPYIEDLYEQYKQDPAQLDARWRDYFERLEGGAEPMYPRPAGSPFVTTSSADATTAEMQNRVTMLIYAFRNHGHKWAHINPLEGKPELGVDLSLASFGIDESMLEQTFATDGVLPQETATLKEILAALTQTYTRTIGVQYGDLPTRAERLWLRRWMEQIHNTPTYGKEQKKRIYQGLFQADSFEKFLHTKYVGMKRFSVEGGDSLIPMLQTMIDSAGRAGVGDMVLGMAHRGRLNVLANIMDKPLTEIFAQFEDALEVDYDAGTGDVKYHFGHSHDVETKDGHKMHLSLLSNPSHLEAVNPLVLGSARAKQQRYEEQGASKVLPLIIHGDAAIAGQGVVPESLNLAQLDGYYVGGTIHVVINNRIGYTAEPHEAFSGEYCTDVARMLQVPIFHVNADDPEACCLAMEMAVAWRQQFGRDVVIDLVCYRRYGHNEGDDPTFTQPVEYAKIKAQKPPVVPYKEKIIADKSVPESELSAVEQAYTDKLNAAFKTVRESGAKMKPDVFGGAWAGLSNKQSEEPKTAISKKQLSAIAKAMSTYPEGFTPHRKIAKFLGERTEMLNGDKPINWGAAENAAYASLLAEGYSIRMSGQDVQRGTFAHRHAMIVDSENGTRCMPYTSLAKDNAKFEIYNSSLSELAVVGFEYGHSQAAPKTLTLWEAQFGDFANGAQIMIDQFISSSETKWWRYSGFVMLLPHGYEGQGPEHSSARLERYLQLCADDNMVIANATTPAQMFHLLRRQQLRKIRKPLVVMTPKSLLRLPEASSNVDDLTSGNFQEVIDDASVNAKDVKRIVMCSGKLYYELLKERTERKQKDVAIVRLEQLYPLKMDQINQILAKYAKADMVWAQEEPRNQGAWTFILDNLAIQIDRNIKYVGRAASATTAVGSPKRHKTEQAAIVDEALSV
jgi:2-oxoglutarate dehydrogenase E1 component